MAYLHEEPQLINDYTENNKMISIECRIKEDGGSNTILRGVVPSK